MRQLKILSTAVLAVLLATPALARDDRRDDNSPSRDGYRDDRDRGNRGGDDRSEDHWILLGEQSVGFNVDRDTISVGREEGAFNKLRIESRTNDIYLYSLRIVFGSGSEQRVQVNALIPAGGRSAPLDLAGDRRAIRTISLEYKAKPGFSGRTLVSVYGSQQRDASSGGTYGAGPGSQSRVLDQETYDRRSDRVEFRVPREARLNQISLRAVDDSVSLESLEIRYNTGPSQFINIYDRLAAGEESRPVDLQSDRRYVTGVTVIKRPSWRPGQGRMELLGAGREPPRPPSIGIETGRAPPGWVLFGAQTVGYGVDRDVIEIGAEIGQFSRIALSIQRADVFLREITLVYANGERETKSVYAQIPANSRTRAIDIPGSRFLRQIELIYQSKPDRRNDRAVVEVYGEYDRSWIGDKGGYRDHNRGWLMLGAQRAQMFSSDDDAFLIGSQLGTFRALRLVAKRHAVRITGIRITYGNGEVETLPLFQELLDGQSTRNIDLVRRDRFIKRIDVRYRTKLNFQGEGLVELWGLK